MDRNGRVELRKVTIGRDFGTSVELLSGLEQTDAVITNPSDSLNAGIRSQSKVRNPARWGASHETRNENKGSRP